MTRIEPKGSRALTDEGKKPNSVPSHDAGYNIMIGECRCSANATGKRHGALAMPGGRV